VSFVVFLSHFTAQKNLHLLCEISEITINSLFDIGVISLKTEMCSKTKNRTILPNKN